MQKEEDILEKKEEEEKQVMNHIGEIEDDSSNSGGEDPNINFFATIKGKSKK